MIPISITRNRVASKSLTNFGNHIARRFKTTEQTQHKMNFGKALIKSHERDSFKTILSESVQILQGIGPKHTEDLQLLRLTTVMDLANYKFYHAARAIQTLAETEEDGGRLERTAMNMNRVLDKAYETSSFRELLLAPVHAMQGISEEGAEAWRRLGVNNIKDLASYKYCRWAEAMVEAAAHEHN